MSRPQTTKRLNRKSYVINMLVTLPVFSISVVYGRAVEGIESAPGNIYISMGFLAQLVALILLVPIILWSIKRLHDLNASGWFAFLLLPPITLFFVAYLILGPGKNELNKWGSTHAGLKILGIKPKGWGVLVVTLLILTLFYITALFTTFLIDLGVF